MKRNLCFLALLLVVSVANANPIVIHHSHDFIWWWGIWQGKIPICYGLITAFISLSIEFLFLWLLLRHKIEKLGIKFVGINSITFPITQFAAYNTGVLSELIPIIVEKVFYNRSKGFKCMGYKGWVFVIVGNAISWFVGYLSTYIYLNYLYES